MAERSPLWLLLPSVLSMLGCGENGSESPAGGGRDASASGGGNDGGAATGSGGTAMGGGPGAGGVANGGTTSAAGASNAAGGSAGGRTGAGGASSAGGVSATDSLSAAHPGDVGMDADPDVIWTENFEEASVGAMLARYDDKKPDGLTLDADVPAASHGAASGKLTASGAGPNAVDFFKKLSPGYDEVFVRYYAKYQANVPWHHTGVWVGGYNPPSNWPNPQAGLKPNGDDRFSVSLEPMDGNQSAPRMDFYDYWMKMRSWMDQPSGDTAYYGNSLVHDPALTAKESWQCIELHIVVNPDPASGKGAELGVWVDDRSIIQFDDKAPLGYWVKDKFCPDAATGTECTDYRPASPTLVPLDLQYRNTTDLRINAFWPQNYITDPGTGSVWYDDMVVAKRRIGCIR